MTKLCPRGKAAAKRKFKVYPSAYANAYASKICAGKIKDPSGVKRKDFKGPKPAGKKDGGTVGPKALRPKFGGPRPTQKPKPKRFQKPKTVEPSSRLQRRVGKEDGGIMKVPGGYAKEGVGRISDKSSKGETPTQRFRNLEKTREGTKKFPQKRRKMKSGGLAIKGRGCEIR